MEFLTQITFTSLEIICLVFLAWSFNYTLDAVGFSQVKRKLLVLIILIMATLAANFYFYLSINSTLIILLITLGSLVSSLLKYFFWDGIFLMNSNDSSAPKILIYIVEFIIWLSVACLIVSLVFGQSISAILAASGFLAIVLGYAAQGTLGNIFSGVALCLAGNIKKGHHIALVDKKGVHGKVIDFDWRAIKIQHWTGKVLIIPHKELASETISNFSTGYDYTITEFNLKMLAMHAPNIVLPILDSAAHDAVVFKDFDIDEKLAVIRDSGIENHNFVINYYIYITREKGASSYDFSRTRFFTIMYNKFRKANIDLMAESIGLFLNPNEVNRFVENDQNISSNSIKEFIETNHLFATLNKSDISSLAKKAKLELFVRDERVFIEGSYGDNLYFVLNGEITNYQTKKGKYLSVRTLKRGDVFGLQSFLLGKPRRITSRCSSDSATVLFFSRADFQEFLDKDQNFFNKLISILETRIKENDKKISALKSEKKQDIRTILVLKVKELFK